MNLKNLYFNLWKTKYERKGIHENFKPVFLRYIGIENTEYNDVLKTLLTKTQEDSTHCVMFDGHIPMTPNFELMAAVTKELEQADVTHLTNENFTLFTDKPLNQIFLDSLNYVTNLAIANEQFFNKSVRNNFIMQMILYTYNNICQLNFADAEQNNTTLKCFYYGDISRRDIYFLILLYRMTFDVVFINPLRDAEFDATDTDKLSQKISYQRIAEVENLQIKTKDATVIRTEESLTLQYEQQIEQEVFTGTGLFKPWQLRGYTIEPLLVKGNIIDIHNTWNEPAKIRTGFKVTNHVVTIPHMFYRIDGTDANINDYKHTINLCTKAEQKLEINSDVETLRKPENELSENDILQFSFCQLSDGTFDIEKLQGLPFYPFKQYSPEMQKTIIEKTNKILLQPRIINKQSFSQTERLMFLATVFNMRKEVQRLIDGFDYSSQIPKIIYYLPKENTISKEDAWILALLNMLAFDIIVFSPAGQSQLNNYIENQYICDIRLEKMNYELSFNDLKTVAKKSKGFFSSLFSNMV